MLKHCYYATREKLESPSLPLSLSPCAFAGGNHDMEIKMVTAFLEVFQSSDNPQFIELTNRS